MVVARSKRGYSLINRILQTLAVAWYIASFLGGLWCWIIVGFLLFFNPITGAFMLGYLLYIWFGPGTRAPDGKVIWPNVISRWRFWDYMADYFPAELLKTADLDPSKNYIFCFHPHGLLSVSAYMAFATDALRFHKSFPGVTCHCLTLVSNFKVPFLREYLLLLGMANCSRSTCKRLLTRDPGRSILLAVGGASEALHVHPKTFDLVLGRRKGFVRIAVETGASLVPVISFGENDLFETFVPNPKSLLARFQRGMEKIVGITVPVGHGEGFGKLWGLMPHRVPIRVVIGAPISVAKYEGDVRSGEGEKIVEKYHKQYVAALEKLWLEHRDSDARYKNQNMRIVE